MSTLRDQVDGAIADGQIGERLWLYATYHCNLTCTYCLTESSPRIANRRTMTGDAMLEAAREAQALGLTCLGVTGGEVFMLPWFPEALAEMGAVLPVVALTNVTACSTGCNRSPTWTWRSRSRSTPTSPTETTSSEAPTTSPTLSTRSPSCSTAAFTSASRPQSNTRPRTSSTACVICTAGWASQTTTTWCARSFAAAGR